MRALSVRQPWAELIASGKKKIEYRTWKVDFREDLLIVASASRQDDDCADVRLDPDTLAYGAAVCVVDLWKVTGDIGEYSWHVRSPRRVEPVAVKGYAAIYNVDDALIRLASAREAKSPARPAPARAKFPASAKLAGRPRVLIATPDARMRKRWGEALRGVGCRVESVRDGYSAWGKLSGEPAACLVLDVDVQGYSAQHVVERMRDARSLAATPVVLVGGERGRLGANVSRVKRAVGAEDLVQAVRAALVAP